MGEKIGEGYADRRAWSDKFVPRQRRILAHVFKCDPGIIRIATVEDDMHHAIDAYVGPLRVSLRVRRSSALQHAGKDFTVRLSKDRSGKNELSKIQTSEVAYLLNCYASPEASAPESESDALDCWYLLDLRPLKAAAENKMAEVLTSLHGGEDFKCMAVDLDSLSAAYGRTIVAAGNVSTTSTSTTTTGGMTTQTITRTVTTSIDPALPSAVDWSA